MEEAGPQGTPRCLTVKDDVDKVNGIRVLSGVPARLVPRVCGLQNLERTLSHNSSTHPSRFFYSSRRVEEVLRVGHVYSSGRSLIDNVNALIPPGSPSRPVHPRRLHGGRLSVIDGIKLDSLQARIRHYSIDRFTT